MKFYLALAVCVLIGCKGKEEPEPAPTCPANEADGTIPEDLGPEVINLSTDDGVKLVANYWPNLDTKRPTIILLHMDPCDGSNRNNWPLSFTDRLRDRAFSVLAIDRRGAGLSAGDPETAAGPDGYLDVKAAVELVDVFGANPIVLVGASNGTTPIVDYELWSWQNPPARKPSQLVLLGGGSYTEAQTGLDELPVVPAWFGYQASERDWHLTAQALNHNEWSFQEYSSGHGTELFDNSPEVADDIDSWLFDQLN